MKSRPILFSAPIVRALLAGTKTQTRRVAKLTASARVKAVGSPRNWHTGDPEAVAACPYGQPGDRLWVKETWRTTFSLDHLKPTGMAAGAPIQYDADRWQPGFGLMIPGKTRVSLFMRRWMSRITLEIVEIRVERLHAITEADALAEGVTPAMSLGVYNILGSKGEILTVVEGFVGGIPKPGDEWQGLRVEHVQHVAARHVGTARDAYRVLWEKLNGPGSWALNPYVWVVTFRRVTP